MPRENTECNGGDGEEVDGDQFLEVIIEECSPTRTRWFRVAGHVLGNRRLGQVDAELEQLAVNPGSARAADVARERSEAEALLVKLYAEWESLVEGSG